MKVDGDLLGAVKLASVLSISSDRGPRRFDCS
jgi:hypothetical protein